jgi:hypothetical protein
MLVLGEVHTGLLRGPGPVPPEETLRLLDLVVGEQVLFSERPIAYARSTELLVGVDCALGSAASARQVRGVGTARQRAAITGGHVVQGSAYTSVQRAERTTRLPWSHYLARPGIVETLGRTRWEEVADAFRAEPDATTLDLGAIASQITDRVQRAATGTGRTRLRSARTRLRWVADPDGDTMRVRFSTETGDLRILHLHGIGLPPAETAALCEDVALHDWLLTSLIELVRKSAIGVLDRGEALGRLVPAIDYLLHLWMPGARGGDISELVWAALERRPGFSRQWDTLVSRIRDQLSVRAVTALTEPARDGIAAAGVR